MQIRNLFREHFVFLLQKSSFGALGVESPPVGPFNVPKALQVLFGSCRIAQVREPYHIIRFMAERCLPPLPDLLKLTGFRDKDADKKESWSYVTFYGDICCREMSARFMHYHLFSLSLSLFLSLCLYTHIYIYIYTERDII